MSCSACGAQLDDLRAGHVAIFAARFHYFCNREGCRARFLGEPPRAPSAPPPRRADIDAVATPVRGDEPIDVCPQLPEPPATAGDGGLIEPVVGTGSPERTAGVSDPGRREASLLLVALTIIAGALAAALELAQPTLLVRVARVVLIGVGALSLLGRTLTRRPDPAKVRWWGLGLAPLLALLVAVWALVAGGVSIAGRAAFLGATIVTVSAIDLWLVGLVARAVLAGRRWVQQRLDVPGRLVTGERTPLSPKELSFEVGPGDHVLVEPDETVPVDVQVVEGDVEVDPAVGPGARVRRGPGDVVVAGSRVTHGQLRGVCTFSGDERALARPLLSAPHRADVHGDVPRLGRAVAERWSLALALLAGIIVVVMGRGTLEVALVVVAVHAATANLAVGSLAGITVARGVRAALGRGVVYRDAAAWRSAARVTAAVFCVRGTLLRGEPELVDIELFGGPGDAAATPEEVLGLAAGALAGERDPVAVAIRRAARQRGVRIDTVRNPRSHRGGVTAVASTGAELCVGPRALLLERHVSVAVADQAVHQLESGGRTVLLVGRGGRLVGLLGLADGLRPGARAAVQHLLDADIEPVLMSNDTRDSCEALGRALDVDHIRPETHDDERAPTVRRIHDAGAVTAVLGHTPHDDEALDAADVSVVLAAAGRPRDDFAVTLVGDDVRDAALALALAQRSWRRAVTALGLVLGPALLGVVVVVVGLLPPEYAPLAQLVGAVAAVRQIQRYDAAE